MFGASPAITMGLNIAGWWFLPNYVTTMLLQWTQSIRRSKGYSVPRPGTMEYVKEVRLTYSLVMLGYLVYTMTSSILGTPPNFYEQLGVSKYANDADLKAAFRFFAKKYHPDRVGPSGQAMFISMRDAYESLKDPLKRYAYDRFGSEAMLWKDVTAIDYLYHGAQAQLGFYIGSGGFLFLASFISKGETLSYWRYFLLIAIFSIEYQMILVPDIPSPFLSVVSFLFPNRVIYQHILFLHQVYVTLSIALTRIFPVLFASDGIESRDAEVLRPFVMKLAETIATNDRMATQMLRTSLRDIQTSSESDAIDEFNLHGPPIPVKLDDDTLSTLSSEMENLIIWNTVHSHPGMKPTVDAARFEVRRRLADRAVFTTVFEETVTPEPEPETVLQMPIPLHQNGDALSSPSKATAPSVNGGTFRFLSPESDDERDFRIVRRRSEREVKMEPDRS